MSNQFSALNSKITSARAESRGAQSSTCHCAFSSPISQSRPILWRLLAVSSHAQGFWCRETPSLSPACQLPAVRKCGRYNQGILWSISQNSTSVGSIRNSWSFSAARTNSSRVLRFALRPCCLRRCSAAVRGKIKVCYHKNWNDFRVPGL